MWYDLRKGKKIVAKTKKTVIIHQERKILIKMTKKRTNKKNLAMQRKVNEHTKQENLGQLSIQIILLFQYSIT